MRNKCGSIFGDIQKPELGIREFTVFSNGIHLFALVIYIYIYIYIMNVHRQSPYLGLIWNILEKKLRISQDFFRC